MPRQGYQSRPNIPQVRSAPAPNPPPPALCDALNNDGSPCRRKVQKSQYDFCPCHSSEKKRLNAKYKTTQADYEARKTSDPTHTVAAMEELVQLGEKVVTLRDEVNRRFFSRGKGNNRGHIQQILKIKNEVDDFKAKINAQQQRLSDVEAEAEPPSSTENQRMVFRSLLAPDVPLSHLDHLPRDHHVVKLRNAMDNIRGNQVDNIYKIFPSLNDSSNMIHDPEEGVQRTADKGDLVIRNVFREYLVWTGDTEVLAKASKVETIDAFLRHSVTDLQDYIKFLEAFKSSRPDTSHFLRDAICDYLLPPDAPCITILGGRIASEAHQRKMGVEGWDILYEYFSHKDTWWFLEQYSVSYDDLVLVKKLSALHRYTSDREEDPSFLHPNEDVSLECKMAALMGFIAVTKGVDDTKQQFTNGVDGSVTERQTRNYITGRMRTTDPLAQKLIQELSSRVVRFVIFVYDRETGTSVVDSEDDEHNWIGRGRTACNRNELVNAPWTVDWSVKNILDDLQYIRAVRDRMMGRDYYEFIIIDRISRPKFDIHLFVANVLMQLSGNLTRDGVIVKMVRDNISSADQDEFLKTFMGGMPPSWKLSTSVPSIQYEGNRYRAWDVQRNHPNIVKYQQKDSIWDNRENIILTAILSNMEEAGVIAKAVKFEQPHATAKLVMAEDGHEDLYWDYKIKFGRAFEYRARSSEPGSAQSTVYLNPTLHLNGDGLRRFAQAFKDANPAAVFAKGKIHTHYCAWPIPRISEIPRYAKLNFCTPGGHLYKWRGLPFDVPSSFEAWQLFLHHKINTKLPFVRATQTTFVICAAAETDVESNVDKLMAVAEKQGWKLSIPMAGRWTCELELLEAEVLWKGIQPLAARAV